MDKELIEQWADEVGGSLESYPTGEYWSISTEELTKFAALVISKYGGAFNMDPVALVDRRNGGMKAHWLHPMVSLDHLDHGAELFVSIPVRVSVGDDCQRMLREAGKPYPRTCRTCGLSGPCRHLPTEKKG